MVVFSQSGINPESIDAAQGAKRLGLTTVGITYVAHSQASASRHSSGRCLWEVVDVVIDNCMLVDEAILEIPEQRTGSGQFPAWYHSVDRWNDCSDGKEPCRARMQGCGQPEPKYHERPLGR